MLLMSGDDVVIMMTDEHDEDEGGSLLRHPGFILWPPGAHVLFLETFWRPPGVHPDLYTLSPRDPRQATPLKLRSPPLSGATTVLLSLCFFLVRPRPFLLSGASGSTGI